jgi:hypothetical protein
VKWNRDFSDLLSAFDVHEVRCLLVGGYAYSFHARPRYTKDLDLWIDPERENAQRVWRALAEFGAPLSEVTPDDFARSGTVFQIGQAPNRVDLLTHVDGLEFGSAWEHRVASVYAGIPIQVIGREDLIANKRAVGRLQDLADVEDLERFRSS